MSNKTIPAELLRKHLPNVTVENGWFGRLNFSDPTSGLKGYVFRENVDFTAKDPAVKTAAYLPLSRFVVEAYTSAPNSFDEELRELFADHVATMWRLKDKWHLRTLWSPLLPKAKAEKRVTRERIIWHLDELGLKSVRRKFIGGYDVTMASGRRVIFSRSSLEFPKRPDNLRATEDEDAVLRFECYDLANKVWGACFFPNLEGQRLLDFSTLAADCGLTVKDDRLVVMKHFGTEATIKHKWGGVEIRVPNRGYVKFEGGAIVKVCGDLLRPALAWSHEIAPDKVVVHGKAELLVMAMHEARAMGITIIPESDMEMLIAVGVNVSFVICAVIAFQWLDFFEAVTAGFFGGYFLFCLALIVFNKRLTAIARRKALEIVRFDNAKPVRKASIDEARKQGML